MAINFSFRVSWATKGFYNGLRPNTPWNRDSVVGVAETRGQGFAWPVTTSAEKYWLIRKEDLRPGDRPVLPSEWPVMINTLAPLFDLPASREIRAVLDGEDIFRVQSGVADEYNRHPVATHGSSRSEFQQMLTEGLQSGKLLLLPREDEYAKSTVVDPWAEAPAPPANTTKASRETEKTWVEFVLIDEEGNPVPNQGYKVELPDGSVRTGSTDASGRVRYSGIDPGTCQFTLTDLDKESWERVA